MAVVIAVALYLLQRWLFVIYIAYLLYARDFMDASAKNARGDVVTAETHVFDAPEDRSKTVIRLHRAGHWFSTTLVEARSWEVLIGLKWRNDDTLDVQLDFGCDPQMERPVTRVGPIHIVYHWGDPGHVPKGGYESDLPPEPCPATGERTAPPDAPRRAGSPQPATGPAPARGSWPWRRPA